MKKNGVVVKNEEKWQQRLLIGSPVTGLLRVEWVNARYHQMIPTAWSQAESQQHLSSFMPLGYQVADAYNLICKQLIEQNFEWLLTIEHDNIIPADSFIKINQYMIEKKVPVVGGLYFTKSVPPEPMIYRGIGWGHFDKWKIGDKVWASGIPMGFTLIHASIIREMWKDAPEYACSRTITRRVFITPNEMFFNPENGGFISNSGTQDLDWCKRVVAGNYFEKAGWPEIQKMKYPFLVDTSMLVGHIDMNGTVYPLEMPPKFIPEQGRVSQNIID
ncbi:MAG: hypothetical protein ACYDBV_12745 [Nitrospiria bacterium]